jgi:hypothetical protein
MGTSIVGVSAALAMADSEEHSKHNGMHRGHHRYQAYRIVRLTLSLGVDAGAI